VAVGGGAHKLLISVELQILSGSSVRLHLLILLRNEMRARNEEPCTSFPPCISMPVHNSINPYVAT
jgi:hypothetical protein